VRNSEKLAPHYATHPDRPARPCTPPPQISDSYFIDLYRGPDRMEDSKLLVDYDMPQVTLAHHTRALAHTLTHSLTHSAAGGLCKDYAAARQP
jgi:hypothetical protein